ncbi:glutamate--cysteine ligase [Streptomyces fradiae]|uniref:carboxylate-amine ligase n=1 Tax=Streptomyces fradiae TaxID=1906 RepID=UPI0020197701|nr:glutamate--cysteine ligase [Streptomyces fradiae]UQS29974.1 glutamate--cysteine ligase [Streptomyces fradiae]
MVEAAPARGVTLGVEEEFLLVGADDGAPAGGGRDVVDADRALGGPGGGPGLQRELLATMVETATGVCTDLAGVRAELAAARARLERAARKAGLRPLASGTAPMAAPARAVTPTRHYRQMARLYGWLADETETCGCHVHVGVPDRESAVAVLNHLRPWLPVLLALSANSPYHQGADTGHASWRVLVLSRWPTHQIPPRFASAAQYDRTVAALRRTGVLPAGARNAYWFARPSHHLPTVEVRIADVAPGVDGAVLQAGLTRALVTTALDAATRGRPAPRLPDHAAAAALWTAARYGVGGPALHPLTGERVPAAEAVRALLDRVRPALEASGDAAEVRELAEAVLARGTGADAQRRAGARATPGPGGRPPGTWGRGR